MDARVLVVGTTTDYVHWIRKKVIVRALFLTDKTHRQNASEQAPAEDEEVCADLSDYPMALKLLQNHLSKYSICINGIACFDCESMELASIIGNQFNVFFQSLQTIKNCRDKFLTKEVWSKAGLNVPGYSLLDTTADAEDFYNRINSSCVLKPLSGAGSELVFKCSSKQETIHRFKQIISGLKKRKANRLFKSDKLTVLAEEFIDGTEYSCDFIIQNSSIEIIRLCEKIKIDSLPFGIIAGYKLIHSIPKLSHDSLLSTLKAAADSVGIKNSICMIDFIIRDDRVFLIEIAPRPGGDCLPFLLLASSSQDILDMHIKLSLGMKLNIPDYRNISEFTALRIFAREEGILQDIDASDLHKEPYVEEINLTASRGREVKLPPKDYDSWILGHYILSQKKENDSVKEFFLKFSSMIKVSIQK